MNPFEMVVGIVLITAIASVLRARFGILRDRKGREYRVDTAETGQLREEIRVLQERVASLERVKDRVEVLERIVTDKSHLLEQEFDRLRDER